MFTKNSRYYGRETVVTDDNGKPVQAVKLRRLPATPGKPHRVSDSDQLDIMSNQSYNDSTRFWYVADANTELEANALVEEAGRIICLPEK